MKTEKAVGSSRGRQRSSARKKPQPPPIKDATRDQRRTDNIDGDAQAFFSTARTKDVLAEEFGEAFLRHVTSGQDDELEALNQLVSEEIGGPFIQTTGAPEFAEGTDESNPPDAMREPIPKANGSS